MSSLPQTGIDAMDSALARVFACGALIGEWSDGVPFVSFTSLFLAILVGKDEFSNWAQQTARVIGPQIPDVVDRWAAINSKPPDGAVAKVDEARVLSDELLPRAWSSSSSAGELLRATRLYAERLSPGSLASVRHLFASYIYRPSGHLEDLEQWHMNRHAWAERFDRHMAEAHPDEATAWRELGLEELPPSISEGVSRVFLRGLATGRQALDAYTIMVGVLADGTRNVKDDIASTWLLRAIGDRANAVAGSLPSKGGPSSLLERPPFAPGGRVVFARAAELARATGPAGKPIRLRHLVAALLTTPLPPETAVLLREAGVTVEGLCSDLLAWMSKWATAEELTIWRRSLLVSDARGSSFAGYDNDEAHGDDRLDVLREVDALAAVLASRRITPPVSVGLFGDWGSGKSFFMNHLQDRIQVLAARSREANRAGQPTSYCADVIQIGFNAWQYIDGNLWASLVSHIFDELMTAFDANAKRPSAEKLAAEAKSLVERRVDLEDQKKALQAAAKTIDDSLNERRRDREQRRLSFRDIARRIASGKDEAVEAALSPIAASLGLDRVAVTLTAVQTEKDNLRSLEGRLALWGREVRRQPSKLFYVAVLVSIPFVAHFVPIEALQKRIAAFVGLLTSVGLFVSWVRARATPIVERIDAAFEAAKHAEDQIRAEVSEQEKALAAELDVTAAAQTRLEAERAVLVERQAAIEAQLTALREGQSFKRYVLERAATEDYRKQLGLIASIHRDLRGLSERLGDPTEPHVDRIVLYIDDLDRCPPERVVEVLQAIHLLLSLPLFVVVVGVDSRWLLQSLEAYYNKEFSDEENKWAGKPQQYLEKIFQIPFTLPPMTSIGFGQLVEGLLEGHLKTTVASTAPNTSPATEHEVDRSLVNRTSIDGPPARVESPPSSMPTSTTISVNVGAQGTAPTIVRTKERPIDLTPRGLEIEPFELNSMKKLAPLIPSPRSAKRLVNLYRIIRAGLDDEALSRFLGGSYETTQLLLAAVVGAPSQTAELFDEIFSTRVSSAKALADFLRARAPESRWAALAKVLAGHVRLDDWDTVCEAARAVARYSFETGRVLRPADLGPLRGTVSSTSPPTGT
jgi:KAP family P-loop domain